VVKTCPPSLGLALFYFLWFFFKEETRSPSVLMLIPVCGAVLILLYARAGTWVAGLLASKPFVALGLVSYSAYLWHQPILAFARIRIGDELPMHVLLFAITLTFVLAAFSWKFIEQPFRSPRGALKRPKVIWALTASAMSCFASLGFLGQLLGGFPQRLAHDGRTLAAYGYSGVRHEMIGLHNKCEGFLISPECGFLKDTPILLWGDSYAKHATGFVKTIERAPVAQFAKSDCAPFMDSMEFRPKRWSNRQNEDCLASWIQFRSATS
jgi:hypothetical protein